MQLLRRAVFHTVKHPGLRPRLSMSHRVAVAAPWTSLLRPYRPMPLCFTQRWAAQQSLFHHASFVKEEHKVPAADEEPDEQDPIHPKHQMLIGFTCKVCEERSHHVMSKIAYTRGVVLIQCPGCKNRHLIADNLGWFRDGKTTIEDLVKEKGEGIRKIVVDEQGVEQMGNLMEWLPEISQDERQRKEAAKERAEKLRASSPEADKQDNQ